MVLISGVSQKNCLWATFKAKLNILLLRVVVKGSLDLRSGLHSPKASSPFVPLKLVVWVQLRECTRNLTIVAYIDCDYNSKSSEDLSFSSGLYIASAKCKHKWVFFLLQGN